MAYFSIINFFGGVVSGLIWLKTGGFLKFYSGNTGNSVYPINNISDMRQIQMRALVPETMVELAGTLLAWASAIFDLVTWPLYWIVQQPWVVLADRDRKRAVVEQVSPTRVRFSCHPQTKASYKDKDTLEYLQSDSKKSLVDVLDWVCAKYPQR